MVRSSRPASGLEAFWDLERYLGTAAKARVGLDTIERESERRGRELVRLALQTHLDARGDGDVGPALMIDDPSGPVRLGCRRHHTRHLLTVFGEVSVTRLGYGTPGHQSIHPLDAELGLPGRTYSYEICRRLVRAAVVGPFDEATALIAEMTGVVVPKRSAETLLVEAAVDFEAFYAARTKGEAKPVPREILVGAIDCKGIPMVKPGGADKTVRPKKGEKPNRKKMATARPSSARRHGYARPKR